VSMELQGRDGGVKFFWQADVSRVKVP
jgi:hypothetical protein